MAWHLILILTIVAFEPPRSTDALEDPEPIFVGTEGSTRLDPLTGGLTMYGADGAALLHLDPSVGLRPAHPPRAFVPTHRESPVDVEFLARAATDTEPARVDAALLRLGPTSSEGPRASVGVYAGPYGPVLHYAIPNAAFAGLGEQTSGTAGATINRTPLGFPPSVGRSRPDDVVSAFAPFRFGMRASLLGGRAASEFRLRGRFALDDASEEGAAVRLRILAGGVEMHDERSVRASEPAVEFDAPLSDASEITIEVADTEDARGRAIVDLIGVAFEGPGGLRLPLARVLGDDEPGIDFFVGSGLDAVVPSSPEPDPRRERLGVIDAKRPLDRSVGAEALLLPFRTAGGGWIGIGLNQVPDATRFAFERGCITLNVPTPPPAADGQPSEDQVRVTLVVVHGASRAELFQRYRETLVSTGGSAAIRAIGTIVEPDWWRHPLVYVRRPPGRGRFATFDTFEAAKQIDEAKRRLGLGRFTVVLDGRWTRSEGDPRPSAEFHGLRGLIAAQHVEGRHVLLRWDLFAAEPGSFAVTVDASNGSRIDPTRLRPYRSFVHEVVRRTLDDQLHSLGADGFAFAGLERVVDPRDTGAVADPSRGIGWREIDLALDPFRREVEQMGLDAVLVASCALPQVVTRFDALQFDPAGATADVQRERIAQLVAAVPDAPIFFVPSEGTARDVLESVVRGVALGVPAVSGRALRRLSDDEAKAVGVVLSLALETKLGIASIGADGRCRMEFEGRMYAETLEGDAGVVVYPDRRTAKVAVIDAVDVRLPFVPAAGVDGGEGGDAQVEIMNDGAILRQARPGVVYRFRVE